MAFLRSVSRCHQSFTAPRKFSTSLRSGVQYRQALATLNTNVQFTRAELLAGQKYYVDLRRELNTANHTDNNERRCEMSTLAATKPANASSAAIQSSNEQPKSQRDPLDVGFNDPIAAFKSKTTWELVRAYFVYLMCSSEYLVENNMKVTK